MCVYLDNAVMEKETKKDCWSSRIGEEDGEHCFAYNALYLRACFFIVFIR